MASMGESRVGWSGGECRCPSDRHYRLPCCLIRWPLSCCCRRRCRKCYWCHLTGRRNFWIMLNFLCFNGSLIIMRLNKTTQVLDIRFKYLVGWIFELNQFASKFELKLIFLINSLSKIIVVVIFIWRQKLVLDFMAWIQPRQIFLNPLNWFIILRFGTSWWRGKLFICSNTAWKSSIVH